MPTVRAPGKVVLSGAYAVLEGAPAIVAAVDRYVIADSSRLSERVTDEVAAAIRAGHLEGAPWFDASALRQDRGDGVSRKLGIGSSAAILAASLAAGALASGVPQEGLADRIFPLALRCHRDAQGGGSGIDVAASCFGGVLACTLAADGKLAVDDWCVPAGLVIEVFGCDASVRTSTMLSAVRELASRDGRIYRAIMDRVQQGAAAALEATSASGWVEAVASQFDALASLGKAAGIPIVTPQLTTLDRLAQGYGGRVGPSGAGGGDIALHVACTESTQQFRARARSLGLTLLGMSIGASGIDKIDEEG